MKTALEWTEETRYGEDKSEARFTKPRPECPHPERWTSEDVEATENEVLDGVYGLVRLLQPEYVLETGAHRGFATLAIAKALRDNGHGVLDAVEIERSLWQEATDRVRPYSEALVCLYDSMEFEPRGPIDFAWLDSGPGDTRIKEFVRFYPAMHDRTVVGFHDTGTHSPQIRILILELMRAGMVVPIFLPTPRGVCLCQVLPHG